MGEDLMKNKGVRAILLGFFAGLLNGLLGAGGGIILVRGAEKVLGREYHDGRDIFANVLCVMLPLSDVSAIILAEGVTLEEDIVETAREKGINILRSEETAFSIAAKLASDLI